MGDLTAGTNVMRRCFITDPSGQRLGEGELDNEWYFLGPDRTSYFLGGKRMIFLNGRFLLVSG